jgi:hypothetical protein
MNLFALLGTAVAAIALVSVEEEIEIGRQANAQVRMEVPELRDGRATAYVRDVGLVWSSAWPGIPHFHRQPPRDQRVVSPWRAGLDQSWRTATGSTRIAGRGCARPRDRPYRRAPRLGQADTRHGRPVAHLWRSASGNTGGAGTAQAAAGLLAGGVFLTFSRDEEREADRVGLTMLIRAGWDGRGMIELFDLVRREAARDPGTVEAFLSSHPSPQDRIATLSADVRRHPGGRRDSRQFRDVRLHLVRLPPSLPVKDNH